MMPENARAADGGTDDGITGVEIEALSDEALEDVAGGTMAAELADGSSSCCSCYMCTC